MRTDRSKKTIISYRITLFACRTFAATGVTHVEAPVTDLLGGIKEQRRVGLLTLQFVGNSCVQVG